MDIRWDIAISVVLPWLIVSPMFASELSAIVESMGNKHECEQYPSEIHWISEKTSALVTGKSEDSVRVCRLKFGLATTIDGARLRLSFDFMYNHACGVILQINESFTSDFFSSTTNREMLMSGCNTRDPGPLFAQPKNFVLVSLVKENERLEAYNFRLNISMAEHLPSKGPDLHVVIIVGFVLFTVVALAAILLSKYITRLSYRLHEQQMEHRARAINIYNSQERLQEPDLAYIRQGGYHQPAKNKVVGLDVTFVNSNGRIETFHPFDGRSTDMRELGNRKQAVQISHARQRFHEPQTHRRGEPQASFQPGSTDTKSVSSPCLGTDLGDTVSLGGCDIPPSYEEALRMPLATDVEKDIDEDGMDIAVGGVLELDYLNIDAVQQREKEKMVGSGD